jgi:endonuclease/exonuclease/phosphatase family metal-dependent hydrolase
MKSLLILPLYVLFIMGSIDLSAQTGPRSDLCFLWYNVENLFYPANDSGPADDEFTPEGLRRWSWYRYRQKLTALAKVIIASGRGEAPELVALCEVENARVLKELSSHPILAPCNYSFLHSESKDHRGMDVACLIRSERIGSFHWETIPFTSPVRETRDIMHITLSPKGDTLDLFLLHLLSKYGGAGATAELRRSQAGQVVRLMDSVYTIRQQGMILAAGDFNEEYRAYSMDAFRAARFGGDSLLFMNPGEGRGSYKYRGRWMHLDQLLVLSSAREGSIQVSIMQLSPLLTEDQHFGGVKPRRTYEGYQYSGGISDHLPLVIDISSSFFSDPAEQ